MTLEKAFRVNLTCKVEKIGIDARFGGSGPYMDLLESFGISAEAIVRKVLSICC